MTKTLIIATALYMGSVSLAGADESTGPKEMHIYKTPWCGCCQVWTDAMKKAGYKVTVENIEDLSVVKKLAGVPDKLESCHTAKLGDYVLEGHVPLKAIETIDEGASESPGSCCPGYATRLFGHGLRPGCQIRGLFFHQHWKQQTASFLQGR